MGAQEGDDAEAAGDYPVLEIPLDTVVRGGVGTEEELATIEVSPEDVGHGCTITAAGENNDSEHPGNNLVVRSGDGEVVLADVEREAGAVTEGSGTLTLGETVSVHLVFGEDKVFSGGLVVTLDCPIPPEPETPETTTTTVTTPEAPTPPPATPVPGEPDYTG